MPLLFSLFFVTLAAVGWAAALLAFESQDASAKPSPTGEIPGAVALGAGAVIAALVLVLTLIARVPALFGTGNESLVRAALEEGLKAIGLIVLLAWGRARFIGWRQGIGYAGLIGAGFLLADYILRQDDLLPPNEWETAFFWRVLVFGGLHGMCAGLTGIGLGVARTASNRALGVLAALGGFAAAVAVNAVLRGSIVAMTTINTESALPTFVGYLVLIVAYALVYQLGRQRAAKAQLPLVAER